MSVFKRPNSKVYYMQVPDGRGGVKRLSTKRTSKREAELVKAAYLKELKDREQLGVKANIKLQQLAVEYIEYKTSENLDSIDNIQHHVNKLIGAEGWGEKVYHLDADMELHQVTVRDIDKYKQARLREGRARKTINLELEQLRGMHKFAISRGYNANYRLTIDMFKVRGKSRWLSAKEEEALLRELDPMRPCRGVPSPEKRKGTVIGAKMQDQYDMTVVLLDTGKRYMEIASMPWYSVDTKNWQWIEVYQEKTEDWGRFPMTERLRAVLKRRYESRRSHKWVFPSFKDKNLHRAYSTKGLKNAIERAGLNDDPDMVRQRGKVTPHTLRDTFASKLVSRNVSLKTVQTLLGHKSAASTQKYARLELTAAATAAVAALEGR